MELNLSQKLQNITHLVIKNILNPEFKLIREKLPLPNRESDTGLFTWDSGSPYYSSLFPSLKNTLRK